MQLSTFTLFAIVSSLIGSTIAAPVNITITENSNGTAEADVPGTSQGIEFPFSEDAIIEAVYLGSDVAPIVLDDSVFFVNTTIIDQEIAAKLSKRDANPDADAWQWRHFLSGAPIYKREASADADAEAWQWRHFLSGAPIYKREASADADAEAWQWRHFLSGAPIYKREASADADAEAWQWRHFLSGAPIYKREAGAKAEA